MKTFVRFLYMPQELPFYRSKTFHRKKIMVMFTVIFLAILFLLGRLVYLMIFCSEYYGRKAQNLHERERDIKAARGKILDANGVILATNKSVCTISVIHSQIVDADAVVGALVKELGLPEETVRKRVEKVSSIERIKSNLGNIIAVGTTSVRTLESLYYMGVILDNNPEATSEDLVVKQWMPYDMNNNRLTAERSLQNILDYLDKHDADTLVTATQIIIAPGYEFKIVKGIVTNFHQPKSTLLLLISAFVKGNWKSIYEYALEHDFRFLSYGDSSLLI